MLPHRRLLTSGLAWCRGALTAHLRLPTLRAWPGPPETPALAVFFPLAQLEVAQEGFRSFPKWGLGNASSRGSGTARWGGGTDDERPRPVSSPRREAQLPRDACVPKDSPSTCPICPVRHRGANSGNSGGDGHQKRFFGLQRRFSVFQGRSQGLHIQFATLSGRLATLRSRLATRRKRPATWWSGCATLRERMDSLVEATGDPPEPIRNLVERTGPHARVTVPPCASQWQPRGAGPPPCPRRSATLRRRSARRLPRPATRSRRAKICSPWSGIWSSRPAARTVFFGANFSCDFAGRVAELSPQPPKNPGHGLLRRSLFQ